MKVDSIREIALKSLYEINQKGAYSNIVLQNSLDNDELRDIDRSFITELVYGTLKWQLKIDWIIGQFSNIKVKKISPWILNILRLGVYQIVFTDKIPESAACDESVKLAKKYGHSASSGFVNGVLRNIARKADTIKYPNALADPLMYLSIQYSHPEWMVGAWLKRYGFDFTEDLLKANNEVPELCVRANTTRISAEKLVKKLTEAGLEVEKGKYSNEAIIIKSHVSLSKLQEFKNGLFQVQDESSMLVGHILDPRPGETVLDVCSAPGGKATHIAQLMNDKGRVIARDVHLHKIRLIKDAVGRLGLTAVEAELFDALQFDGNMEGKADRVLVDAPCSGLGIIRRKPDIKWARNISDKKEITGLQKKILSNASRYVKDGGILVYSTCTLEPEENENIIRGFLEENREFNTEDIKSFIPSGLKVEAAEKGYIQLYPNIHGVDGFFIAKLRKRG